MNIRKISTIAAALVLVIISAATELQCQSNKNTAMSDIEKAIQARLDEIQNAAQALNPDKVFSFVLDNNQGALVQNGKLFLTREQALESTKQGFQGIQKIAYQFDKQHITLLSPTVALAVSEGLTSVTTNEGRTFTRRFAQSVVFVLTNGEWKVFHSHQSAPPA